MTPQKRIIEWIFKNFTRPEDSLTVKRQQCTLVGCTIYGLFLHMLAVPIVLQTSGFFRAGCSIDAFLKTSSLDF